MQSAKDRERNVPVKMRLHRVGAKHQPSYRIIISPALAPRDGSYLDQVGIYNPRTEPATLEINNEKAIAWLRKGVQPTDRVAKLLAQVDINPSEVRRPSGATATVTESLAVETEAVQEEAPAEEEAPKAARRRTARKAAEEPTAE